MSESELSRLQQNYKLKRPRIIKSDFRRTFPMHLAHVFNACSYEYLMQHINTYYVQDVTLKQRDLRPSKMIVLLLSLFPFPSIHVLIYNVIFIQWRVFELVPTT